MNDGRGSTIATSLPMYMSYGNNPDEGRPVNVYLLKDPDPGSWDGYVSCVVTAHTVGEARLIHPHTGAGEWPTTYKRGAEHWVHRDDVELIEVTLLGTNSGYPAGEVLCREKYERDYEET